MTKRRLNWIPLTLFVFSLILRLALVSRGPYHLDCLNLAIQSEKTLATLKLHGLFGTGYPLVVILGAAFIGAGKLFHITDPVLCVNIMSAVFGALCIPLFFLITQKMFDSVAALFSSVMLSILPVFLALSTYGKSHTPSLFFLLGTVYLLLRFNETSRLKTLIQASVCAGLMGATRTHDLILIAPALSFLIYRKSSPALKVIKDNIIFWIPVLLISASFHFPLLIEQSNNYAGQARAFMQMGVSDNFLGLISPGLWSVYFMTIANFTVIGILLALGGLTILSKKQPWTAIFLSLWIFIPLFFYGNIRTTVPRFYVISYIPLIAAQGYVFSLLLRRHRIVKFSGIFVYSLILFLLLTGIIPILTFRHQNEPLPDYCRWVKSITPENSLIITSDEWLFIDYYSRRRSLFQLTVLSGTIPEEEFRAYKAQIDNYLEQNVPVYITEPGLFSNNFDFSFVDHLLRNYRFELIGEHMYEDWHSGETVLKTYPAHFWKILPKKN